LISINRRPVCFDGFILKRCALSRADDSGSTAPRSYRPRTASFRSLARIDARGDERTASHAMRGRTAMAALSMPEDRKTPLPD
jgi:hypothetical protein